MQLQKATRLPGRSAPMFMRALFASATWDPANIVGATAVNVDVTCTGAKLGDFALASHPGTTTAGTIIAACVRAADTVNVNIYNGTGGALDVASGLCRVCVLKAHR